MTKVKILLFMALLLSLTASLSVTSVTLQNVATSTALQGSIMGGTKLYIKGLGFSQVMDENAIYVGDYPCHLEDGATVTAIVCSTSAPGQYKQYWNLDIVVIVEGQGAVVAPQKFSYTNGQTPYVYSVSPSVSYGGKGTKLFFYGSHKIFDLGGDKDLGDVYGIYVGDSLCSRFGIFQGQIGPNGNQFIECYQATLQKAGKYNISEHLFPGRSSSYELTYKATLDNKDKYQFVVLPLVNDTTHSGSKDGQQLLIKGTGFSLDLKDVSVEVDGVNCMVTESTFTTVKCTLQPKTTQSSNLTTSQATPTNNFISGSGFFYKRYDISSVSPQTITKFRQLLDSKTINASTLQDEYVSGQLKTQVTFGSNYGQVWKGYFKPSVSGQYKFRGVADDAFAVFLSTSVHGSTVSFASATPIAYSDYLQASSYYSNYYQIDYPQAQSGSIALQAGKNYYMEVYHINKGGNGKFSLSVEVPNSDTNVQRGQTYQVHTVTTSVQEDPEIVQFTSSGLYQGTINLKVYEVNMTTLIPIINQNITIPWNATASQFCSKLNEFSWFGGYSTTCTLTTISWDDLPTTDPQQIRDYIWRASIAKFRSAKVKNHVFKVNYSPSGQGAQWKSVTIQEHSPLMSGTFTLSLDSLPIKLQNLTSGLYTVTDIPYNVDPGVLRSAFRQINGLQQVQVQRNGDGLSGAKWIVYYIGYNNNLPDLAASGAGLRGGKSGATPQITAVTRRNFNTNLFVDPIDYRWMATYSDKPSVRVTVSGIPSACNADCSYTFVDNVPILTAATLSTNVMSLTISDPANLNAPLSAITVTLDNQPCYQLVGTMTSFTCTLPQNFDNTPIMRAGDHMPVVKINPIGLVKIDAAVTAISKSFTITSIDQPTGGLNGGYQVLLIGTGFPASASDISFSLCSKKCTVFALSNIQSIIIVPSCQTAGLTSIQATYKNFTASIPFTYGPIANTVEITAISPVSWSPVMKGVMMINGTGFGTDPLLLKAVLTNSSGNIYQMKILENTDTTIKVGIPGGLPGNFEVNIIKTGFGNAIANPTTANDFVYEVLITGVSPNTGSIGGGTLITISGKNFVPDVMDTLVHIGNQLNQLCKIETITSTEIKCRTPQKNFYYNVSDALPVTVDSKLIMQTNCSNSGPCFFTYVPQENSPLLESLSSTTMTAGVLTLTGKRFMLGTSTKVSLTNKITRKTTEVTPTSASETQITLTLPALESGIYAVRARTDPIGESNSLLLTVSMNIASTSQSTLSVNGGQVKIIGSGFPQKWPNSYFNKLSFATGGKNLRLTIMSISTSQIVLKVPQGINARSYSFTITNPMGVVKSIGFSQQTSSTPNVNMLSTPTISPNVASTVTLNRTNLATIAPETIQIYSLTNLGYVYDVATWTNTSSQISFSVTLNSGKYGFRLYDDVYGWYSTSATTVLSVSKSGTYTVSPIETSFNGGLITVTGNNIGDGAVIKVNGIKGNVQSRTATTAVFNVPKLVTALTQSSFKLAKNKTIDLSNKVKWGDSIGWQAAFDTEHSTMYSSNNPVCSVGIDIGQNLGVQLTRIRFFPNPTWQIASQYIKGALIQVSNDNTTWATIATVDQTVHAGWNSFMITDLKIYRYIRFSHTQKSKCSLAQLQFNGIIMSSVIVSSTASFTSDIVFDDGVNTESFPGVVQYKEDHTPIVTGVSPDKGSVFGGYDITLTGLYFSVGTPTIKVDDIPCVLKSSTATQIVCTVGSRLTLPSEVSFNVLIGGIPVILQKRFRYVMRWSDHRTWGTDLPPVADDLVYIPHGMHLLVDQSTPLLKGIIVENGTIEFADESDMIVRAEFITLRGGQFIAGSEQNDYDHKLTFIMYGNYFGAQQPMFGNKGIGCLECKFSMIGKKRTPTWTMISATINPGENQLTTIQDIDWKVGEQIVVASTSYDHNEAEQRTIKAVSGRTITVNKPFVYKHFSGIQTYGASDKIQMRAEVGLLTRNIVMMGDQTSVATDYGSHLMLTGSAENGLVGKIAYTQFTKCGQPQITGRYCHHFHMNGDVPESYSIGNSVHQSMARILTIHGVNFLYVAWNVGYRVKGHNFFIEDGVETNNILEYNLAISSLLVNNMMQTDMSVASFWVTNPTNHLRYNHAAGSDFYGFWYEIKERPDGPSATEDVCPIGNPTGESHDNVAHSNVRFGLRIFKLYSRQNPCLPIRNDGLVDPWSENPSIESKFYNYVLWKNGQAGLLAQEVGNMVFENFTIAENRLAGMEFYKTNFTKEHVIAKDFIIIGKSIQNPPVSDTQLAGSKGAILPRTGEIQFQNIRFYSFTPQMTIWQTCSKCDNVLLYTNFGATYYAKEISYENINGAYFTMLGLRREVFYDTDGTLTNGVFDTITRTSATLIYGWQHILQDPACKVADTPSLWHNGSLCNQSVTVRQVMFTNILDKQQFRSQLQKARMIANIDQVTAQNQTQYTSIHSLQLNMQPMQQAKFSYSLPYITGRTYNIWWGTGIDFQHMAMVTSHLFKAAQNAVLFKFNYTDNRELYEISPLRQGRSFDYSLIKLSSSDQLVSSTCQNGDYYHNNADGIRVLELCASGKNRTQFEYIDVNAVYCRYLCPAPPGSCTKQKTVRNWNNATQWPNGALPVDGDNITIPCQWTVLMDMSPAKINYFEINGDLIIPDTQDIKIVAQNIWIKGGSLKAGSKSTPFTNNLVIEMIGNKNGSGFTVSPDLTGNKMFVVTGKLELFGIAPSSVWTRMTAFADKGTSSITVASAAGWKVGDQIGIAPSFTGQTQFQKVTITGISSNTVTFTPALKFSHYGDASATIKKSFGTMDMRTGVAHLTRNIKITSGGDEVWGFTLIQFGYSQIIEGTQVIKTGKMTLSAIQFIKGGQYDTEQAGIQIFNVRAQTEHTTITKSSFHECQDFCMKINNAYDLEITNNVFFNARKFHVKALQIFSFVFMDNLMIGVTKRSTVVFDELIACFASYDPIVQQINLINVANNLCQGSQGNGYAVPHVNCADIDTYPFAGNTAGSCDIGWIFSRGGDGSCLAAKGVYAYGSQIGQIHNPASTIAIKFKNFILADNVRSMTVRIGGESEEKTGYIYDSYITAIARPSCPKCYGAITNDCTGNHGFRMLTTGSNGQNLPRGFGNGYDVVCKKQTIDGKVFIYNTEFNNFRQSYPNLPQCSNNVIFKPHTGGSVMTGSHHLFDSNCTDCQLQAYGYFKSPPERQLGWFGGCGSILCTGNNNYLIHDHSGTFLPKKGVLLANNSWIGDNTPECTKVSQINGHYCTNQDFGVLEYESVAPDFNTRIMWPVYLKFDGGNWTSQTNGWKEWQWNGGQPLNKRLGRFVSVVKLHKIYNMTFSSAAPDDMTVKIQKRLPEGNASDWVIVKLRYPTPNSIRVQVNGRTIKPISLLDNNAEQPLNTSICGSNKFFYKNYTIHFAVTGDPNCKVRVFLSNSIQLTTRFAMNIDDFFRDDGVTKFINRMLALLSINDTSRVKVVGVYTGSVQIVSIIQPQAVPLEDSTSANKATIAASVLSLQQKLNLAIDSGDFKTAMVGIGFGEPTEVSSLFLGQQKTVTPPQSDDMNKTGMIIGIVLGAALIIGLSIVGAVCYMRRRARIGASGNEVLPMETTETHKQAQINEKAYTNDNFSHVDLKNNKKEERQVTDSDISDIQKMQLH